MTARMLFGEYYVTEVNNIYYYSAPLVCAITTLDIDHSDMLGDTLTSIAWHKAGIIKRNSFAITSADQTAESIEIIAKRAADVGVSNVTHISNEINI